MKLEDILLGLHVAVKVGAARTRVIVDAIHAPVGAITHYEVSVRRPGSSRVLKRVRLEAIHDIGATYLPGGQNGESIVDSPSTEQSRANLRQSNYPVPLTRTKSGQGWKAAFVSDSEPLPADMKVHISQVGVVGALYGFKR